MKALDSAKEGNIAVLTFHGVPDKEHPCVNLAPGMFEEYLRLLEERRFTLIPMRDLDKYVRAE